MPCRYSSIRTRKFKRQSVVAFNSFKPLLDKDLLYVFHMALALKFWSYIGGLCNVYSEIPLFKLTVAGRATGAALHPRLHMRPDFP